MGGAKRPAVAMGEHLAEVVEERDVAVDREGREQAGNGHHPVVHGALGFPPCNAPLQLVEERIVPLEPARLVVDPGPGPGLHPLRSEGPRCGAGGVEEEGLHASRVLHKCSVRHHSDRMISSRRRAMSPVTCRSLWKLV